MNASILISEVQDFIQQNLDQNITKLVLKGSPFSEISIQEIANQIEAKNKSEKKLPTWFHTKNIIFPPKLSIEQTSSEITAAYKASLIKGDTIIDVCAGFGVDSFYFSKHFKSVIHCEINPELSEIVTHNYKQLGVSNIETIAKDGLEYLKSTNIHFDWMYIDPSRRDDTKNKVFLLEDCAPNIPENLDLLFEKADRILIKVSPILDITSTLKELNYTKEVHVVAVNNEVKELLFVLEKGYQNAIEIKTINFQKNIKQQFDFTYGFSAPVSYALPETYLYEPNSAILKSGGFNQLTQNFEVEKLEQHSHLYTSKELIEFPGRRFHIEKVIPYNKKDIAKHFPQKKANITVRNFPKTVAQLRKETKIKDGGTIYAFFTKLYNKDKVVILTKKIK